MHSSFPTLISVFENKKSEFFVETTETHGLIAQNCMRYLIKTYIPHQDNILVAAAVKKMLDSDYPLFEYANLYWSSHLNNVKLTDTAFIDKIACSLTNFFEILDLFYVEFATCLGHLLLRRYGLTNAKQDLAKSIDYAEKAVSLFSINSFSYSSMANVLSIALCTRYSENLCIKDFKQAICYA